MAFLTVAGIDLRVLETGAVRHPDIYTGGRERMRGMNIVSIEDNPQQIYDCTIDLYSSAEEVALRAAAPRSVPVTVSGDWIGTSINAVCDIGDATPWVTYDGTVLIYKTVALHIEEVAL